MDLALLLQALQTDLSLRYALIVGVLIALCSSVLGVTLVLKRFSFIGDGLSHVAFGAMCVAAVVGLTNNMVLVLPVTIVCAVLLLMTSQNARIKGDSSIAMISVGALAVGYLLRNLFPVSGRTGSMSADVCSTLFGGDSILWLSDEDVRLCLILSVLVLAAFLFFYNKLFAITFDESFATATGTRSKLYNLVIAVIIAVIVVLGMQLVGSLLISALVVFPAMSAMRLFKSFRGVTLCAACISLICAGGGILLSYLFSTPVGSTIVVMNILIFTVFSVLGLLRSGGRA